MASKAGNGRAEKSKCGGEAAELIPFAYEPKAVQSFLACYIKKWVQQAQLRSGVKERKKINKIFLLGPCIIFT